MLRGLALAILLLNLALLLWGGSRAESQTSASRLGDRPSAFELPTLVLLDEVVELPVAQTPFTDPCLSIGPLDSDGADALEASAAAWNLHWQRRDGPEGSVLNVGPGRDSTWPESDLRALAGVLAAEISSCRMPDPIAPEPSRP